MKDHAIAVTSLPRMSRRRVIAIAGIAAGLPLSAALTRGEDPKLMHRWTGQVLGAQASITLYHPDAAEAAAICARSLDEVERLEQVFSLYRSESEIRRLNRFGRLDEPSVDMTALLAESLRWSQFSDGAFDVSVQPLFQLYATHFTANRGDQVGPSREAIEAARQLVDFRAVVLDPSGITFAREGMALTLNGIAQGYITDRVAELLRGAGVDHVLLDLGEMRTVGERPGRSPWRVGLRNPFLPSSTLGTVELSEGAIASSGGYGCRFDAEGHHHHLFDPQTGQSANYLAGVSVIAARAVDADALSTALAVMSMDRIPQFLSRVRPSSGPLTVIAIKLDGSHELFATDWAARLSL